MSRPTVSTSDDEALMPAPEVSARRAGLRYVSDEEPGYRRKKWGKGFTYLTPDGEHLSDDAERARIEALAIPPAWSNVWICRHADGHLQATGRDDAGRKQYRYHEKWQQARNRAKFDRLIPFGEALPALRTRCAEDLKREGLPRAKVMAAVVRLLEATLIRIGNDEYAQGNDAYGLTTMRDRHVTFSEKHCVFEFQGKSGQDQHVELADADLAEIVRDCRDLPGYEIFQYFDDAGDKRDVKSHHVNTYLHETTGAPFTAKDFRTWGGTVRAAGALSERGPAASEDEAQKNVARATKAVAEHLGNTKAVCRDYYIHPAVTDAYHAGALLDDWRRYRDEGDPPDQMRPDEHATLHFLRER